MQRAYLAKHSAIKQSFQLAFGLRNYCKGSCTGCVKQITHEEELARSQFQSRFHGQMGPHARNDKIRDNVTRNAARIGSAARRPGDRAPLSQLLALSWKLHRTAGF